MLKDTLNTRIQKSDTSYVNVDKRGKKRLNSQKEFSMLARKAQSIAKSAWEDSQKTLDEQENTEK